MDHFKKIFHFGIILWLLAWALAAQQTTAKIFGTVQLEDGSLVPGVNVEATSPKLVGKATAVTDENGAFRLVNLTPGTYKVVFTLQGFQTVIRDNVPLVAEQTLNLKVEMQARQHRGSHHHHRSDGFDRRQEHGQGHDPDQGNVRRPAQGPQL